MASITIEQTWRPIGRTSDQTAALIELGINRINRVSELQDSPEARGMIRKVQHMVEVVEG